MLVLVLVLVLVLEFRPASAVNLNCPAFEDKDDSSLEQISSTRRSSGALQKEKLLPGFPGSSCDIGFF